MQQSAPAAAPLAVVRTFRPYYSPLELDRLVHLHATQNHKHLSQHRIDSYRQLAAAFIERVANRLGFPRRTIATAQKLYHRFHLHFSLIDFPYHDVSLAALLVASKLEDSLRKLRDIQIAAAQVQHAFEGGTLLAGSTAATEGDPAQQEAHRPHLIGIERLILQTICFNLNLNSQAVSPPPAKDIDDGESLPAAIRDDAAAAAAASSSAVTTGDGFRTLFRLAATLPALPIPLQQQQQQQPSLPQLGVIAADDSTLKSLTRLAFLLLTDLHRTLAPLSFPPHTCAAACIYLAGYLLSAAAIATAAAAAASSAERGHEVDEVAVWDPDATQVWAATCESEPDDLSDISQTLLDLLISLCPPPPLPVVSLLSTTASSTNSPHLLVSPHSSLASPSESSSSPNNTNSNSAAVANGGGATTTGKASSASTEREKHLLAAGCPNAFTHPALRGPNYLATADELMKIKIRVRAAATARQRQRQQRPRDPTTKSSPADEDGEDEEERAVKRARRWAALDEGMADFERMRDEKDLKERIRAEERADRHHHHQQQQQAGEVMVAGADSSLEERERERRERKERLKPGSVRYRF
ncbi:hypothetical protein JCM3774_006680 [Rhodotorula dairenensis]